MAKEKEHINLVFIGHVDHGKSTTVGRLLFDSGNIDEQAMRKLKEKGRVRVKRHRMRVSPRKRSDLLTARKSVESEETL